MNLPVGEELGTHIVEMVTLLQMTEILPKDRIIQDGQLLSLLVELVVSVLLKLVAQPSGHIPLLVSPGDRILHVDLGDRLQLLRGLGRSHKLERAVIQQNIREIPHKIEYPRSLLLMLPEGLVIHKQVHNVPVGCLEPGKVLLTRQRPILPASVREAESDVVAQRIVAQQQLQMLLLAVGVDVVRTLPSKNMTGSLSEHHLETKVVHILTD